MSVVHLNNERVFEGARLPLLVQAATTVSQTPRVAVHCTKLMYIAEGSSRLTHSGGVSEVAAGDVVAIPDGYWCAGTPIGSVKTLTVYANTEFMMQQASWVPQLGQFMAQLDLFDSPTATMRVLKLAPGRVCSIGKLLHMLAASQLSGDQDLAVLARLADVFNTLSTANARPAGQLIDLGARHDRHVDRAIALLHEQLDRCWMITDLASELALSPSQLTRVFRAGLGITPAEYLRQIRVEEMARLLTTTDLGVAEAARRVGWRDLSHASRAFKRLSGVAPSHYTHDHLVD